MPHGPMSRREPVGSREGGGDDDVPRHRSQSDPRGARKTPGLCPLCGAKVRKIRRGTRHARHCAGCGGTLNKEIRCPHCRSYRVWTGKRGCVCHGCGHDVDRAAAQSVVRKRGGDGGGGGGSGDTIAGERRDEVT